MGPLTSLLSLPVSGPLSALTWIAKQIQNAANQQLLDPARIETALLLLERRLENGEIQEAEFEAAEEQLLAELAEITALRQAQAAAQDEDSEADAPDGDTLEAVTTDQETLAADAADGDPDQALEPPAWNEVAATDQSMQCVRAEKGARSAATPGLVATTSSVISASPATPGVISASPATPGVISASPPTPGVVSASAGTSRTAELEELA